MPNNKKTSLAAALILAAAPGLAQDKAKPTTWWGGAKLSAYAEAGITANPDDPEDGINFGHLFTDKANQPLLNQLGLVFERPIDPAGEELDLGFKLHAIYGTDARYTHFFGQFDRITDSRYQFDIVEAFGSVHLPGLLGGLDLKLGQYVTPLGYEVIDPRGNFFYSKSYIFNFGLPLKHTGALATLHVSPMLDLIGGVDAGVNASLFERGDNNDALGFIAGFGLNGLLDGRLTVLALTHIGAENPRSVSALGLSPNGDLRYINDVLFTMKWSDAFTTVTELNYIRDDGFGADGGGIAQYAILALNDSVSLGLRGEVWRDEDPFYVAKFFDSNDFINIQRGLPIEDVRSGTTGGRTTYGAVTLGLNYKPPVPEMMSGLVIRPELRYDRSLNGTRPYDSGTSRDQVTFGIDVIVPFSIF